MNGATTKIDKPLVPFSVLFIWIIALTWATLTAVERQQAERALPAHR